MLFQSKHLSHSEKDKTAQSILTDALRGVNLCITPVLTDNCLRSVRAE